ncbi:MAG: methylmalonyl Co-A mutase-associated GTPase MeaB [Chloroflexi bacterium]|nr:methylmalonyl Co-A mutase-associated GTPase MeaB [Chloroflexota bacterium]
MTDLVKKMLSGDRQSLARLITLVEREGPEVAAIMAAIYPHTGKAFSVGVTGPPGGGKSTLVARLTSIARGKGSQVGVLAVDPTSPFSGGAILGDRVRMQQHYLDDGVFIRSMATRGSYGGLPKTASSVVKVLDAAGKDIIYIETVGVGQTEIDIMEASDTTVVVLVPEAGDTIQTMKAGLMEIADVFVVNKADRPGADYLVAEIQGMLHQNQKQSWWQVPVVATQAANDVGTEELFEHIERHRQALEESGNLAAKRAQQRRKDLLRNIEHSITKLVMEQVEMDEQLATYLERVAKGEIDPYSAAKEILSSQTLLENWLRKARGN